MTTQKKRAKSGRPTALLPDRPRLDDAFQFLRRGFEPYEACEVIEIAVLRNKVHLEGEENGKPFAVNPVKPSFFKHELRIEPTEPHNAPDGRWHATVTAQKNCRVDGYDWFLSPGSAIEALLRDESAAASDLTPETKLEKVFKRGRKEYSDEELEPFKIRFYLMLSENVVPAKGAIVVEDYVQDLIDWGGRIGLEKIPQRTKMITEIGKWFPLWSSLNAFKD